MMMSNNVVNSIVGVSIVSILLSLTTLPVPLFQQHVSSIQHVLVGVSAFSPSGTTGGSSSSNGIKLSTRGNSGGNRYLFSRRRSSSRSRSRSSTTGLFSLSSNDESTSNNWNDNMNQLKFKWKVTKK